MSWYAIDIPSPCMLDIAYPAVIQSNPMLGKGWLTVCNVDPTLNLHWVNILCGHNITFSTRTDHTDTHSYTVQSQKAVSAYCTSEQILPFGFAEHSIIPH